MAEIAYTVRLAPELLERIERIARERGVAARKLIRAVLAQHFGENGNGSEENQELPRSMPQHALDQILFDVTRTRLTLQHLLDQQVGSETTDQIRQTAQAEAERYMQKVAGKPSI